MDNITTHNKHIKNETTAKLAFLLVKTTCNILIDNYNCL